MSDKGWAPPTLDDLVHADKSPRQVELRRVGDAVRAVIEHLVATEAEIDDLRRAAAVLEGVADELARHPRRSSFEGFAEAANAGTPNAFFDDSPLVGRANPLAPPLRLWVEPGTDDRWPAIRGSATFGSAYEGPPGHVHGGFVAAAFDEVLGMTQSVTGQPGMTGALTVRYRSPTPLHVELDFRGRVERVEGRKIFVAGTVHDGDTLTAEAEGLFISVDFARIAAMAEARRAAGS